MGIIKHILLLLFGLLSGIFGFLSIIVVIALTAGELLGKGALPDNAGTGLRIFWKIWLFIICEILLAFGITASLLSLRCVFGPKNWIIRIINYFWSRAVKFALILPFLGIGCAVVFWFVKLFVP